MKYFIFLAFLMLSLRMSIPSEICILPEKEHLHHNYEPTCKNSTCGGKLSFKCGLSHCSKNSNKCIHFLLKTQPLNKSREFKLESICLNGNRCFVQKIVRLRSRTQHKISKNITCPCNKN